MPSEVWYDDQGNGLRYNLRETFQQRPALNAVIALPGSDSTSPTAAAFAAYTIANRNFEVLGTNMTTALCTFNAGGGITLTTAGADNDQAIVTPHLDTTQSSWAVAGLWGTENSVKFSTLIKTGASVADAIVWAGIKLTNTPTVATDDNQVFFRATSAAWTFNVSRAGTDETFTIPTSQIAAPVASTLYKLEFTVEADRTLSASINGVNIRPNRFAALTDAIDLIPYIGVAAGGAAAAKAINVHHLEMSRLVA